MVEGILFLHPELSAEVLIAISPIKFIHELLAKNPQMPFNQVTKTKIDCVLMSMRAKLSLEMLSLELRKELHVMLGRVST